MKHGNAQYSRHSGHGARGGGRRGGSRRGRECRRMEGAQEKRREEFRFCGSEGKMIMLAAGKGNCTVTSGEEQGRDCGCEERLSRSG